MARLLFQLGAVFLICVLNCLRPVDNLTIPSYEFEIEFQHRPVSWHRCPEGWLKIKRKCYKVFFEAVSWNDAEKFCQSFGGSLARINGFNSNRGLGKIIQEFFGKDTSNDKNVKIPVGKQSQLFSWIGFNQDIDGQFYWSNGETGSEQEGFWSPNNPPFIPNIKEKKCCDIGLNETRYGKYRWILHGCEQKRPFVCEIRTCERHEKRCADGRGCICKNWFCDGMKDCLDGSDERDCNTDVQCGGTLSGTSGIFHSPNYPKKYTKYTDCQWRIETAVGSKIQLTFNDFDLESKYDYITIFDGSNTDSTKLGHYTGNDIPTVPLSSSNVLIIHMKSDHSKQKKGFQAAFHTVLFDGDKDSCGGSLHADDNTRWFTSPRYPQYYPDNLVCDWIITAQNKDNIITLQFGDFEFENPYDWIEVRNGDSSSSELYERFSGDNLPKVIISTQPELFVRMNSDFSYGMKGFNATYKIGCDIDIINGFGKIESPGYGVTKYPNNLNCKWRIADPYRRHLTLTFNTDFNTEKKSDIVSVYNDSSHPIQEFSGKITPLPTFSNNGKFQVHFTSDKRIQRSGWTASVSYDCNKLVVYKPVIINSTSNYYGSIIQYNCDIGYILDGPTITICDINGQWRPNQIPTCFLINCGPPRIPENGMIVKLDTITYGGIVQYDCIEGYELLGDRYSTCNQGGWSTIPTCDAIYCPKVLPPINGIVYAEDNRYGASLIYKCKVGYRLVGSAEAHCQADKTWSSPTPTCQAYHCPIIKGIENGDVNITEWVYINQAVKIICNNGYQPSSDPVLICMENEKYDKPIPSCDDVNECSDDDNNNCNEHECQNTIGSYQCSCKPGYQHSIGTHTTCQDINECSISNGSCNQVCNNTMGSYFCSCYSSVYELYDGPEIVVDDHLLKPGHTCIAPCKALDVFNGEVFYHGTVLPDGKYIYPTVAYITCPNNNTIPDGDSKIQCQFSGGWTDTVTQCRASDCVKLDRISNGYMSKYDTKPDSVVEYHCYTGYKLEGIDRRICQLTSIDTTNRLEYTWTGTKPSCSPMDCGMLPIPSNGLVTVTGTRYGDVATFNCYCGFELEGSRIRHCSANGTWSGLNTQCNSVGCRKPEVPVYGSIMNEEDTYPAGSIIHYQCDRHGYTLTDPSPLQCTSERNYQPSTNRPKYQLSIQFHYRLDSVVTLNQCNIFYQDQLKFVLQEYIDNSMYCEGQVSITVLHDVNKTLINDNEMFLVIDLELTILYDYKTDVACSCGNELKDELAQQTIHDQHIVTLQSKELICPIASLSQDIEKPSHTRWTCLPGQQLDNDTEVCDKEINPVCIQGCIERFPDLIEPIETTISTSSIGIDITTTPDIDTTTSYFQITTLEPEVTTFEVETTSDWETTTISHDTTISSDKTTDRPLTGITTRETTPDITNTVTSSSSPSSSSITVEATDTTHGPTTTSTTATSSVSITEEDLSTSSTSGSTTTDIIPEETTETDFTSGFSSTSESSTSTTSEDFSTDYMFSTTDSSLQYSSSTQDSTEGTGDLSSEGPISTETSTSSTSAQDLSSKEPSSTDGLATSQGPTRTPRPEATTGPDSITQLSSTPELSTTQGAQSTSTTQGPPVTTRRSSTQDTSTSQGPPITPKPPGSHGTSTTQGPPVTTRQSSTQDTSTSQGPPITPKPPGSQGTSTTPNDLSSPLITESSGTTLNPGTTIPTPFNASFPVYLIAVYDKLSGSFNDNVCIDSVHSNLNNIVNSILTSFPTTNGCQNSSKVTILLQTGNAGFRNTYVDIDIIFGISTTNKDDIESCSMDFQRFLETKLPKLLSELQTNLVPNCASLNYTGDMFNITDSYWGCMDDYKLNHVDWICEDANVADLSVRSEEDVLSTYGKVDTVPTVIIKFNSGFQNRNTIPHNCRDYYEQGLHKIFENLEPILNSKSSENCKDIYISVADHITVKINGKKVDTSAHIYLYPQSNSVNSQSMGTCKSFVLSVFNNPDSHSLSMIKPLNFNEECSSLVLSSASLTLKGDKYVADESCCMDCVLDKTNYKCIHESIPNYEGFYTVKFTGVFNINNCGRSLKTATKISLQMFYFEIKTKVNNLCQSKSVILDPISSVQLVTGSNFITVKFPILLKSVDNIQNDTVDCYNKITSDIDATISRYAKTLLSSLEPKCQKLSEDSVEPEVKWQCNKGYVFNSATLTCNKKTDTTSSKGRGKRSVPATSSYNKPYWNSTVPQCIDTMKPNMSNCESLAMFSLGEHGPVPVNVSLPQIQDNSGYPPAIQFIPSDFRLPYTFTDIPWSLLRVIATDDAGNEAVCNIQIYLMDVTPPRVQCPELIHTVYYDDDNISVAIDYSDVNITASDLSGISHVEYLPAANTIINMMNVITVQAIVFDENDLNSTCYFKYQAQSKRCPDWSLETPSNGDKACSGNVGGANASGYSCNVRCAHGYDFAVDKPNQYICVYGGKWSPHNYVPDCTEKIHPSYELMLAFNFTYNGQVNQECWNYTLQDIFDELEKSINKTCSDNDLKISVYLSSSLVSQVIIRLKMDVKIEILNSGNTSPIIAKNCGLKIIEMLNSSTDFVVSTESCGNSTLFPPADAVHGDKCPYGHIFKNNYCLACTKGTYKDEKWNNCTNCAVGWYQDEMAQTTCKQCTKNTSTESVHSKNSSECILICKEGEYSSNGLFPCNQCSIGYYQSNSGSTACTACPTNLTTVNIGSSSSSHCKERCGEGNYSKTGLEPCHPCQYNFYSSNVSSLVCTECPNTTVTTSTGSTSLQDCIEVDQCEKHVCKNGATCVNKFRYYTCSCAKGFTGDICEFDIDDCFSQPCLNNGSCTDGINSFQCNCTPGYTGQNCETEIDLCTPNYCQHGVCVQQHGVLSCQCFSGYQGDKCTSEINECIVNPVQCLHGGICTDLLNDYICDCSGTGFNGTHCETNIDDCCDCSCLNGGTCNDLINAFNCTCAEGFTGTRCETMISYCYSSPCKHDSICTDKPNGFTCTCQPGYKGILCEQEINECLKKPCLNQATCSDYINYYNCSCPTGFTGKNCDINIDDCLQSSCNTNGTDYCVDEINSYQCVCLPYWTGDLCENTIDQCVTEPCYNNATCRSIDNGYRCTCLPDYTGSTCSVQIDDCLDKPCLHNGICIDDINNYTCNCGNGFEGSNCEININECDPNPCKNEAKCSDLINGFTCRCEAGWNGTICDSNIDDCTSQPCFYNATCVDLINDFSCNCTEGYDGKTCDNNIDDCSPQPCKNGGSCTDLIGNYSCQCLEEYEGYQCEFNIDDCVYNNTCLNNATCIDGWRDITCQCTQYYTGDDCGKEKTDDYDLLFHGVNGSICQPDDIDIMNSNITLCFWLRFADVRGNGTYFNLLDVKGARPIVVLSSSDYTVTIDSPSQQQQQQGQLKVNDGYWHHICFLYTSSSWSLYLDGDIADSSTSQHISIPDSQRIILGQSYDTGINQSFHGEISQLNIYNYTVNESVIYELASNCTNRLSGDILEWRVIDTYIRYDVDIIQPTICGSSICQPGYRGTKCDIKIDKIPPVAHNCPEEIIKVTNGSARLAVTWEDPDFTDDIGVTIIQQTHRSGQVFPLGEYLVSYIAYDAENNSAECNFGIIVKPFDCINPPAPENGLVARKDWEHGRFCVISCIDPVQYDFVEFPPPFYSCGKEGFWDPPRGNPFRFPPCAALFPPQSSVEGGLGFTGLECTEERKEELRIKFIEILSELDERLGLCSPGPCTYEGVVVECGTDGGIRFRRSVNNFNVNFNFNISSNSSALQDGNRDFIAEEIETSVKNGDFDTTDFQADENTLSVNVKLECDPGQSSRLVQGTHWKCVNCPEGYYLDNNECLPCDIGQYTDEEKQTKCKQCPVGMTTGSLASTNISQCYSLCDVGQYYESSSSRCIKCYIGEYQDQSGQTQCKSCPIGETTIDIGSTSITDCGNLCKLGEELSVNGECVKCPKGSYRDDLDQQYCQACPYGWTTSDVGSISISQCTVAYCQRGEYLKEDNTCESCAIGTYQPNRGETSCIVCGVGLTTANKGSTSRDDCKPGPIDECLLEIDDCDNNAECLDEEDGFNCVCNFGFTGNLNGSVCTDNCHNKCDIYGQCNYDNNGNSFCSCQDGYHGDRCDQIEEGISGAIIGGVTGTAVAIALITVIIIILFSRRKTKSTEFQSNERIYRNKQLSLVAFQNGAYEVLDADSVSDFFMENLNANRWSRSVYSRVNEVSEVTHM